jgi:Tat protein secretion system quality control protein TatD with DNase activity
MGGDRGGGRENKKASLKTSKKNPGAAHKFQQGTKASTGPIISLPPPHPGDGLFMDCGAALLSRLFDRDRDRVLQRAREDSQLGAVVAWTPDTTKQKELADLCKEYSGFLYFLVGIHPESVGRTNNESVKSWAENAEKLTVRPQCVGILSGLHMGREFRTHFAQKSYLSAAARLCDKLKLPLVLHCAGDGQSFEQAVEVLRDVGWLTPTHGSAEGSTGQQVILHDGLTTLDFDIAQVEAAVEAGVVLSVSAAAIDQPSYDKYDVMKCVPMKQLVVCSDSPRHTPQNLEDEYLRTLRNEPCNLPAVVKVINKLKIAKW